MSASESCCKAKSGKPSCDSKSANCNCKTFINENTCISIIDCCGEQNGVRYCICVCKCGDKFCVGIIDCEKDSPLEQNLEQFQITAGKGISCNSKCFVEGDTCITVIDCCQNLSEKPSNCVCVVNCNGKLFKCDCSGTKQFSCKCKRSEDGFVHVDCNKSNCGESSGKCIVVCYCKNGEISVNVKNCSNPSNTCTELAETDYNCECKCFVDKGICVAICA